jgi:hypothetical protein
MAVSALMYICWDKLRIIDKGSLDLLPLTWLGVAPL